MNLENVWPAPPDGQLVVLAIGKSAERMASAALRHYSKAHITGLVVTPAPPRMPLAPLHVMIASHPVPDATSAEAGRAVLQATEAAGPNDHILVLLSGGASSLAVVPRTPFETEDIARMGSCLLKAGAPIADVNMARRHVDRLKGGGLAIAANPAPVTLAFASDVVGDDPRIVGSGPTTVQPWQPLAAAEVLRNNGLKDDPITDWLERDAQALNNTRNPRTPAVVTHRVVAQDEALQAAVRYAATHHALMVVDVCPSLDGDALKEAERWAANVPQWRARAQAAGRPVVAMSGGEVTVKVTGDGRGGPNSTFAVAFGLAVASHEGVHLLAADTDGVDGVGGHAGGFSDASVWRAARPSDARNALRQSDTLGWLEAQAGTFTTGRTGVNANDLRMLVVEP